MDGPRMTWLGGGIVFVLGLVVGFYWMSTREGLAALGGPVTMMVAAGLAILVMLVAIGWSLARHRVLPPLMLVGTALLALAAGVVGGSIVVEAAGRGALSFDLPLALLIVAVAGFAVTAWAWTKRPRAHA